jgi:O-antigen ligase
MYHATATTPPLVLWLFYAYLLSCPFFGFSLLNAGGRGLLRIDWLAAALFVGAAFFSILIGRLFFRRSPINLFVLLFAYSALISIFSLFSIYTNINEFIDYGTKTAQLMLALPFFFSISSLPLTEEQLKHVLRFWLMVALFVSIYALYQVFAIAFNWPFGSLAFNNPSVTYEGGQARVIQGFGQVSSFFREPSYLGAYLLAPIILMGVFLLKGKANLILFRVPWVNWGIITILLFALLLTSSQAAYLTLLITIASMYTISQVGRPQISKLILVLLILALVGGSLLSLFNIDFFGAIIYRFKYLLINMTHPSTTLEITSYRVRTECMKAALEVWKDSPIIGVGLNTMSYRNNICEFSLGWSQLLADQGLIGTLLMALIFGVLIRGLYKLSVDPAIQPFWSVLCLAVIFILISEIVDGIFTYNWVDLQRWINLAIANLVLIQARSSLKDKTPALF